MAEEFQMGYQWSIGGGRALEDGRLEGQKAVDAIVILQT